MLCDHPDELAEPEIFSTGTDHWKELKRWDREHPDRPVLIGWDPNEPDPPEDPNADYWADENDHPYERNLAYSHAPSPYRVVWPDRPKEKDPV